MFISLRPGEKVFINGAVLRADRKVSIELLNDVSFLLEAHVMQAAEATTPLRQLYFTVQIMLINPGDAKGAEHLFERMLPDLCTSFSNREVLDGLHAVGKLVLGKRLFEALKTIRGLYAIEQVILSGAAARLSSSKESPNASVQHHKRHNERDLHRHHQQPGLPG